MERVILKVKILDTRAKLPTVNNPGEDLAYDLYAIENVVLKPGVPTKVRTGIAATFVPGYDHEHDAKYGLLIRDRSSMAAKGIVVTGGVVDAGYRGEILVVMTNLNFNEYLLRDAQGGGIQLGTVENIAKINKGDKIAQAIPLPVLTSKGVSEVAELPSSARGQAGFGSSGV